MVAGETAGDKRKMIEKDIDDIFKGKLAEYETPVDASVWTAVERSLDKMAVAPVQIALSGVQKGKIGYGWRKVLYWGASVAALLVLGLFLLHDNPEGTGGLDIVEEKNGVERIVAENVVEVTKMQDMHIGSAVAEQDEKDNVSEKVWVKETNGKEENGEEACEKDVNEKEECEKEVMERTVSVKGENRKVVTETSVQNGYDGGRDDGTILKRRKKEYTFALASNFISSSNVSVSPQYLNYMSLGSAVAGDVHSVEQISETQYSLPLNVGIQAQVKVNDLLSLGLGINYTLLKSKYDALINKKYYHVKQNLHYIGVPVNLYFSLVDKKNFFFYANIGGAVEKGINASYKLTSYDAISYSYNADMSGFQFSANVGFGMEYRFIPMLGVYLEPNLVYYFNSDMPASIRTDQPLQVKAELGFRFHINNK